MPEEAFLKEARESVEFNNFVDDVSPRKDGVQQVWLTEVFFILKLLWEIYNLAKDKGCFQKKMAFARTKIAMRKLTQMEKQAALQTIKDALS